MNQTLHRRIIETERLRLSPPRLEDARAIADLANDRDVAWMTTGVIHPYRLSDAEAFLQAQATADLRSARLMLIEHAQFGPLGMLGFHYRSDPYPELGYWLGRTYRGRGFATEAVRGALDWALAGWGRRVIGSGHFVDNPASARVLEKAGFLYTGVVELQFSRGRGCDVATRKLVRVG